MVVGGGWVVLSLAPPNLSNTRSLPLSHTQRPHSNLPFVRDNFTAVVLGIVAVSLLPLAVEVWMAKREAAAAAAVGESR